ncbi:hypothetical protein [Micromonospora carbonacea]|uniref:Uncharacterized protein n=1 Tax=Micromonospora carbonacea TaxID=47853 RepID=A0A1C5AXX6_9ACTN|nr:hypothetical protein [Micromonospora carbonacea]SCF50079.1 hypothetical protein GA0070563_12636 [Micromonospora carbonacea]
MTATYFRIQTADRNPSELLNPEHQTSGNWHDIESLARIGVSVCDSRESLAAYLAQSGIPYGSGEWVIVELRGDLSDDDPCDAEYGELLIHPTEIVSVSPMGDEFLDLIGAAYDLIGA